MMFSADEKLNSKLNKRIADGSYRKLTTPHNIVDFCSNDYLGFAKSGSLKAKILRFQKYLEDQLTVGSTGSRLISGNSALIESLETFIAAHHQAEAGLIFNSGFDANLGFFSCVPQRGDTVLFDELVHASIRDGVRLSFAESISFRHNDVDHLKELLANAQGTIYIAVESLYSMNGDFAPLKQMSSLATEFKANLVVDEAHATGIFGAAGKGIVCDLQLEDHVFARVLTFGKALGCHGAIVIGTKLLRDFLINFSRPFIYTTALPFHSLVSIKSAYDLLSESEDTINNLFLNITLYKKLISQIKAEVNTIESTSQIQTVIVSGNEKVKLLAKNIQEHGFDVRPIMSPTVPVGTERLRICIHAFNTEDEIARLVKAIEENLN